MRFFADTEFIHRPPALQLVSIGLVAEDGREYYAVSSEWALEDADAFVRSEVVPRLAVAPAQWKSHEEIRDDLAAFTAGADRVEFFAYNGAFDWLVLVGLFGRLEDLPANWPRSCWDLKQWEFHLGGLERKDRRALREAAGGEAHNALADARQNLAHWQLLAALAEERQSRRAQGYRDEVLRAVRRELAPAHYSERPQRRLVGRLLAAVTEAVNALPLDARGPGGAPAPRPERL